MFHLILSIASIVNMSRLYALCKLVAIRLTLRPRPGTRIQILTLKDRQGEALGHEFGTDTLLLQCYLFSFNNA